jgi:hypothetical protein
VYFRRFVIRIKLHLEACMHYGGARAANMTTKAT